MGRIPALKKTLETFVYRIKDVFFHNDLLYKSDFKCATLKHRTIDGREVRSSEDEAEDESGAEQHEGDADGEINVSEQEVKSEDTCSERDDEPTEEFHC